MFWKLFSVYLLFYYADVLDLTAAAVGTMFLIIGIWYTAPEQKHWWPQAEAMVGFFNTWQITGDDKWLYRSVKSWEFVKRSILDKLNGEWVWGINEDGSIMTNEDKVGVWKCPYHNSRACIEIIRRVATQEELTAGKKWLSMQIINQVYEKVYQTNNRCFFISLPVANSCQGTIHGHF